MIILIMIMIILITMIMIMIDIKMMISGRPRVLRASPGRVEGFRGRAEPRRSFSPGAILDNKPVPILECSPCSRS